MIAPLWLRLRQVDRVDGRAQLLEVPHGFETPGRGVDRIAALAK
jgi:hypothetical protein